VISVVTEKATCGFLHTTDDGKCRTQKACKVVASWMVGVVLTDKRRIEETTVWLGRLVVCNRHRQQLTLKDVLTDSGWQKLIMSLIAKGHRKPKRSYSKLTFKHLRLDFQ
jgi:hypothetical protein